MQRQGGDGLRRFEDGLQKLVALFGERQRLERAYHAVFARGAEARSEAQAFVEWLRQEIEALLTGP